MFKWFSHQEGHPDPDDQYFCPLCGASAGTDSCWTSTQLDYVTGVSSPAIDQLVQDSVEKVFKGVKGVKFKLDRAFSLGNGVPDALEEPDDILIAAPPCHPNEPVKVPGKNASKLHCLFCGSLSLSEPLNMGVIRYPAGSTLS